MHKDSDRQSVPQNQTRGKARLHVRHFFPAQQSLQRDMLVCDAAKMSGASDTGAANAADAIEKSFCIFLKNELSKSEV